MPRTRPITSLKMLAKGAAGATSMYAGGGLGAGRHPRTGGAGATAVRTTAGGTTGGGAGNLSELLKTLTSQYEETRTAKQQRYEEGKGILEGIVEQFGPGYLKGEEQAQLASMEQGMVGRGLGGTTRPVAVGVGIKARTRERATAARTGAMTNVAQFMAGFQDIYPQPGTLASLATSMEAIKSGIPSAPPMLVGAGPSQTPTYLPSTLSPPATGQAGPTTGPGPGVASATVGFGPSAQPTGAGAATYGVTGGYTPQIGDQMNVAQGPGGPILPGSSGGLTPWQQQQASESWWRGVQ